MESTSLTAAGLGVKCSIVGNGQTASNGSP